MKHLINREDYIKEYLRISNSIENDNELFEGLLSTVFGGLKMLFKKDWANIKCKNPSVLEHLKAIDKSLEGFTMTKMQFSGECTTIRQNIADYFNDILEYKLAQIEKEEDPDKFLKKEKKEKEENKEAKGVAKNLNLKDKTLLDSLDKYKSNINTACKPSPKLREYADQMLNSVEVFVNDIVLAELEKKGLDKAKLEEENKKNEEEKKRLKEIRKKMDDLAKKGDEESLKKLNDERDKALRDLGANPMGPGAGDKAIDTIINNFSEILSKFNDMKLNESVLPKSYSEILKSDVYLGLQKSFEELDWNFSDDEKDSPESLHDKFFIRVILNKINTAFNVVAKGKDNFNFKDVPSASIQSLMISLTNAIIYGFMGDKFDINKSDARLSLLTKCAIDSDATIGFNLPLIDNKKPENGNFFVGVMNQFVGDNIKPDEVVNAAENLSTDVIKKISQVINGGKEEDVDVKDKSEFAKEFGDKVMSNFKKNMSNLFDSIRQKAQQLKEDAKKAREAEATKAQQKSEANEKSE